MQRIGYIFCFFCLLFCGNQLLYAQTKQGLPFITNYSPEEYGADPQNWYLTQDQQGIVYVANTTGIIRFDGVEWTKIELPNVIARSVATLPDGTVCVGSQSDFGYLEVDAAGHQHYVSLVEKLPEADRKFADVWSLYTNKQGAFFFTNSKIFLWDNQGKFTVYKAPKKFNFCFQVEQTLYFQEDSLGLYQLANGKMDLFPQGEWLRGKEMRGIVSYDENHLLLFTNKDGAFLINKKTGNYRAFATTIDDFLTSTIIFDVQKIDENYFAVGTFRGGWVILDKQGRAKQVIDEGYGLRNNSVRRSFIDSHKGVWLALNNGIARIELNSPLSIFDKKLGLHGIVNQVVQFQDKFFVGTSLGVFEQAIRQEQVGYPYTGFNQLANFKDQAWGLLPLANELLIGSNTGSYVYSQGKIQQLSSQAAFVHLLLPKQNKPTILVGLRSGIEILQFDGRKWLSLGNLPSITGEVRSLIADPKGNIWAGTKVHGVYKINFENDLQKPVIQQFTTKNGLPDDKQTRVFFVQQKVLVGCPKGFYELDTATQQFKKNAALSLVTQYYNQNREAWQLQEDSKGNFWVWTERFKGVLEKNQQGQFRLYTALLSRIPPETVNQIFCSYPHTYIATANALYVYDHQFFQNSLADFSVLLRRVSFITQDSTLSGSHYKGKLQKLPFSHNSLSFDFAATHFDSPEQNLYQYQLEGYEKHWSAWGHHNQKDYTNLWNGKYTLKVRAKNIYGNISNEKTYSFEIMPPWYRTNVVYALYLLLLGGLFYLAIKFYTLRLRKQNEKLENLVQLRTAEIQQQKEEIEAQRDNLEHLNSQIRQQKAAVEQAYDNIQLLSEMGTSLTSLLNVETIITTCYENLNKVMDAQVFAAGVYNADKNRLDFYGINARNEPIQYGFDYLTDETLLSVWAFNNQEEVFINDFASEYQNYLRAVKQPYEKPRQSLLYLPLRTKNKQLGVISVQSFDRNAYNDLHRSIFAGLATYISIALENAHIYSNLETKNQQITNSIRYAQTIQSAILPTETELKNAFGDNYFVFFQPKDVVSGDFYWLSEQTNQTFFVLADCTGHGVPGAFMSLIGATLLNEIINQKQILSPAAVLSLLHEEIRRVLRQKETNNRDGMDIILCKLQKQNNKPDLSDTSKVSDKYFQTCTKNSLVYSGAKRPLFRVSTNYELEQLKSTYKGLGGGNKEHIDFEEFTVQLQVGETLYLCSDGYADQSNGENEKIGTPRLRQLLGKIAKETDMTQQKAAIADLFFAHKGTEIQRDDVTVVGIRVG